MWMVANIHGIVTVRNPFSHSIFLIYANVWNTYSENGIFRWRKNEKRTQYIHLKQTVQWYLLALLHIFLLFRLVFVSIIHKCLKIYNYWIRHSLYGYGAWTGLSANFSLCMLFMYSFTDSEWKMRRKKNRIERKINCSEKIGAKTHTKGQKWKEKIKHLALHSDES